MIDFHSHIIFDVDDGSKTIEESVQLIKEAKKAGFQAIIATPHYMEDYYECHYQEIEEKIQAIEQSAKEIGIVIYHGNEIYTTTHMNELLDNKIATSINGSRYVLFELPMNEKPMNLLEVVYQIIEGGRVPIIAHPERYTYVQKDPNMLVELIEEGVLFQSNFGSITGQYGKQVEKTVKQLLKNNCIHFLGSDVHRTNSIYTRMKEVLLELEKTISKKKIKELTYSNPRLVLENAEIDIESPIRIKEGFFQHFFS